LKNGWFEIKKEFVAGTNAGVLIIGNFSHLENVDIMDQRNTVTPTIDILVDDISIVPMKPGSCPNRQKVRDWLYSIHRRHSEIVIPQPDIDDSVPDVTERAVPQPQPKADTPKSTVPAMRAPTTDTIIVHNIQFDFDKYLMENPDTLKRYRSLLTKPGVKKIQVVGYTDDAGSDAYNLALSQKRAREVARQISSEFGIPPALIGTEGRGISRKYPARYLNRRVEIYIFH
ncbi:MAG TPA: OmpA family protein, partial [Puia sp.]|nr:OmpA family protein [Puia sp.]